MNATDILKYGQGTVLHAIDGFPEADWETAGACGVWSVKDIIAHLTSYEHVLVDVLTTLTGGGSKHHKPYTPYLAKFTQPDGLFNDAEVDARKEKTIKEVLAEFNDTHTQVMAMLAQIPEETRRQTGTLPWYGMDYALDDYIVYAFYGHKREHSAQIDAFRDRL